jgi:hypothetical protein
VFGVSDATRRFLAIATVLAGAPVFAGAVIAAATMHPHSYPAHWDHRVAPIAHFVEQTRNRHYMHPVEVQFLAEPVFKRKVGGGTALTPQDRADLRHATAQLRALGLVHGDIDLAALGKQLAEEGIIGLYVPADKKIYVRGTQLTVDVRVTLAHELTHALDDQHFDLGRLNRLADRAASVTALVEGDAVRVQNQYVASLAPRESQQYADAQRAQSQGANFTGIPPVMQDLTFFPYVFGPVFVEALAARGTGTLDQALREPPRYEAQILDPDLYLDRTPITHVRAPRLDGRDKRIDEPAEFGQFSLFEVLSTWLGYERAWSAVQGWRGDQYVSYTHDRKDCIAIATAFDEDGHADTFAGRAREWSAAGVPAATVERAGSRVIVRSCDPGPRTPAPPAMQPTPFEVLSLRASLIGLFVAQVHASPHRAMCITDDVISHLGAAHFVELNGLEPADPRVDEVRRAAQGATGRCTRNG